MLATGKTRSTGLLEGWTKVSTRIIFVIWSINKQLTQIEMYCLGWLWSFLCKSWCDKIKSNQQPSLLDAKLRVQPVSCEKHALGLLKIFLYKKNPDFSVGQTGSNLRKPISQAFVHDEKFSLQIKNVAEK